MLGERLGNWIIDRAIGQGGMGKVYLAREETPQGTGRLAAVKVLAAALAQEPKHLSRFQREIDILRQLHDPGIVAFYEWGTQDGLSYYAMEYVDGQDFGQILQDRRRLPYDEVLEMALQVCSALKHAHDRGVIHRDIKPSNLLRTKEGRVKLTDFGIAHMLLGDKEKLTVSGAVVGTAEYLSPEQAAGKPATKRSDLYSLGVVMYTLVTGRTPFEGQQPVDLLHKHRFAQFDRPQKLVPTLPDDLDDVICQLLEKNPANRPADARVLQRRLDSISRKLSRKAEQTDSQTGREETLTGIDEDSDPEIDLEKETTGPATLMSRLMRQELERQNRGGPVKQFFNHPVVLVTLFLATVALLVWGLWPPSADSLYRRISTIMETEDGREWYKAEELMDQLDRKYPEHPYKEQLRRYRALVEDRDTRRSAERAAARRGPVSEAEWFYLRGLRLQQEGDRDGAVKVWGEMIRSFRDVPEERPWVALAERGVAGSNEQIVAAERRWGPVEKALEQARQLHKEGKTTEAQAIWKALEDLYGKDGSARPVLEQIQRDRGQQ